MGSAIIGNRLRELRDAKGVTQAEVGKALHVDRTTVNNWESGARDLKTEYAIGLADYYNTTCDYILRGVQPENVTVHRDLNLSNEAIEMLKFSKLSDIVNFLLEHADTGIFGMLRFYFSSEFEPIWTDDLKDVISSEPVSIGALTNMDKSIFVRNKATGYITSFPVEFLPQIYLQFIQDTLKKLRTVYKDALKDK